MDPILNTIQLDNSHLAVILLSDSSSEWLFNTKSVSFGKNNDYELTTSLGTFQTKFEIGFNGIGLPSLQWSYYKALVNLTLFNNNISISTYEQSYVYVENTDCSELIDIFADFSFNLTLSQ